MDLLYFVYFSVILIVEALCFLDLSISLHVHCACSFIVLKLIWYWFRNSCTNTVNRSIPTVHFGGSNVIITNYI